MLYIKLFEEFTKHDVVVVKGRVAKVISEEGDEVTVKFFKPKITKTVNKDDVELNNKCLSQCDKKIVGVGNDRYIQCSFCGKGKK